MRLQCSFIPQQLSLRPAITLLRNNVVTRRISFIISDLLAVDLAQQGIDSSAELRIFAGDYGLG